MKPGRPTLRKNGKPLTKAEQQARWRRNKRAKEKAAGDAKRQARLAEVSADLGILPLAVAEISETDLSSASVRAIITDPPYPEDDLPVYRDLADLAMRVLEPSGWCIALVGNLFLPHIIRDLESHGLLWRWQFAAYFSGGGHARITSLNIFQNWKPVLVFQKPPRSPLQTWGPDLLKVDLSDASKNLHPWQQSESLFRALVQRFSAPGDLVADPFAGSGTTLRAALALNRRAWGSDNGAALASLQSVAP